MRVPVPLGGADRNYNSRKSRPQALNAYIETNTDKTFRRIRRTPGFLSFSDPGLGPIRGMYRLKNFVYIVSRNELYRVDEDGVATLLGDVGGSTSLVKMNANGTDENEVIVISDQLGYLYDDIGGFRQITDPDFEADLFVASLNQIFWVNKPDSNVFIGSDTADGDLWDALRFGSAEQSPDPLVAIVATKTNLWLMGSRTCEYWQTDQSDLTVPVRPVAGATIERGVGAQKSVAQFQDQVFWLADDFTVWRISGSAAEPISDLNLEYAIAGEGFGDNLGYEAPERAEGFFIDHPVHKLYVLNFPTDQVTWVYDVSTGLWHRRESEGLTRWRGRESVIAFGKVLVGDYREGKIWEYKDGIFNEDGDSMKFQIVTPSLSDDDTDLYINHMELTMEVGVGGVSGVADDGILKATPNIPTMKVEYSKDGGVTFKTVPEGDLSIGSAGQRNLKVIARFNENGQLRRGFNWVMRFTVTDDVAVIMYDLVYDVEKGM